MIHAMIAAALAEPWMIERPMLAQIERIVAREESLAELARVHKAEPEAVVTKAGRLMDGAHRARARDSVVTIPVRGPIIRHATMFSDLCGATSVERLAADLQAAVDSPACTAIILECDTPGGQVTGIGELAQTIRDLSERKPIHAYVDGSACSAGYYLAAACTSIVTAPMGRTGSIGVILSLSPKDRRPGADCEFISSDSPMKNPDPASDAGVAAYQAVVDELANVFVTDVARFRGVSEDKVRSDFGRGGTAIGAAAVACGLADRVGSYESLHAELSGRKLPPRPGQTNPRAEGPSAGDANVPSMWKRMWAKVDAAGTPEQLADEMPEGDTEATPTPAAAPATPTVDPELAKALARIAELESAQAQAPAAKTVEQLIADAAASFADGLVASNRAVPAERDGLFEDYTMAASDDAASPVKAGPSRVDRLKARIEARPRHSLTTEQIGVDELPADARVLPPHRGDEPKPTEATPEGQAPSEARRKHLLSLTEKGREVLAREAATAK